VLDLDNNNIALDGATALLKALQDNDMIQELCLEGNAFNPDHLNDDLLAEFGEFFQQDLPDQ